MSAYGTDKYIVTVKPESGKYLATVHAEKQHSDQREGSYVTHEPLSVALADDKEEALRAAILEGFDLL